MADDETSWWSQTKSVVAARWHRTGWKTVAHVAVPLAIIFAAVAVLQRVEMHTFELQRPHSHHLHIPTDPTGPNWADILLVILTLILAIGGFIAGYYALGAVREARRARNAVQMTELSRRWDEEENQDVRRIVRNYAEGRVPYFIPAAPPEPGDLREPVCLEEAVIALKSANHADYRKLITDPNFLEDIAIMINYGGIDFDIVKESLGWHFAYRWSLWRPTVIALRIADNALETYENFEKLAKRMAVHYPKSFTFNAQGEIVWDGVKD